MFFWAIMEPILTVLLVIFLLSQIAWPAWRDTPTFPLVRRIFKRKRRVEEKVRELKVAKEVKGLEETAAILEQELNPPKKRKATKP